VLFIDWSFALLAIFGARVLVRLAKDISRSEARRDAVRVLIVGAGDAGEALAREVQHRPQLGITIAAFVDDQKAKWRSQIRGIEVRGPIAAVGAIAEDTAADEVLLAIPSASGRHMREIIHHLATAGLKFRTMPGLDQLATGKAQVTSLREVNVDDLLRRQEIVIGDASVRVLFHGRRIVVTGAGGSIGAELVMQILKYEPSELHLFERSELALYNCGRRIERELSWMQHVVVPHLVDCADAADLVSTIQPAIVVHAAAYKHVPLGEQNPAEYVRNNCLVARRFAEACANAGAERFIFISTDKAIKPSSAMGASKRAAEIALLDLASTTSLRVMVVRFGNIIGSSGSVVPLFLEQIANGGPVTVTHPDVTRYFLRSSEAISLILQTVAFGDSGRVYMLDMGEPIRIVDLARDLIELSNHGPDDIPIVFTGLRPGEKLREDLLADHETVHPTRHPQVMVMEVEQPSRASVAEWYRRIEVAVALQSSELTHVLRELIPEYDAAPAQPELAAPAPVETVDAVTIVN
jgi:FlaA1/EpsC-like NDP-sugar epimerase